MRSNNWFKNGLASKGLLLLTGLILVVTVSAAYSLTLLDNIVHNTLYNYGLHFSYDWAATYWVVFRTIQVLVGLTAVLTLAGTILVYRKYIQAKPEMTATVNEKLVTASSVIEPRSENVVATCPKCGTEGSTAKKRWTMAGRPDKAGKRMQLDIGLFDCPKCTKTFQVVLSKQKV